MLEDLVPVPQLYPEYSGETYAPKYGGHRRFWFWSGMGPEDALLLQCFDSHCRSPSDRGLQHAQGAQGSFKLREDGSEIFHRSNIEVRFLVVTERGTGCLMSTRPGANQSYWRRGKHKVDNFFLAMGLWLIFICKSMAR